MAISEREFLLLFGIIALLATALVTEWELSGEDEQIIETKPVHREHNFHSETFDEMVKGKVYKW